jgi:phage terminase large subunit
MREFFKLLEELGLYDESRHRKNDYTYTFENGTMIEFFSIDNAQKVRGQSRDILWANEANELSFEEYNQLNFRTTEKLIFDFNPSDDSHWLYDVKEYIDAVFIHSTYKDNPFLQKSLIKQMEDLIKVDNNYYQVYALGLPAKSTHTIYTHQKAYAEELPKYDDTILGLDFGYNHSTALVRCRFRDDICHVDELIFEKGLTTSDLIEEMNDLFKRMAIPKHQTVVADWARPEIIEELNRNGFNVIYAHKAVKEGISNVKSYRLYYDINSPNIAREFKNYKWKTHKEQLTEEPEKIWDDAMDAMRYAMMWHKKNRRSVGGYDIVSF